LPAPGGPINSKCNGSTTPTVSSSNATAAVE